MSGKESYLKELNSMQCEAVVHTDGPVLIVAGAGAGKTKTVTHRILHLIKKGTAPHQILAITFTNKAAREMKDRVQKLIEEDTTLNLPVGFHESPFIGTFHRLGIHILRSHAVIFGIPKTFSIFDRDDSMRAIKRAIKQCDLDPKEWDPKSVLNRISREKGNAISYDVFSANVEGSFRDETIAHIWQVYASILKKEKAFDFDDLLLETLLLLRVHNDVRQHYHNAWRFIHVDEYQDTNRVQYELIRELLGAHNNLCVVGDSDQTIYGWRGADIKNIMRFDREFKDAKIILLEENYRSTKTILSAAHDVIQKNTLRHEKKLFTNNADGDAVTVAGHFDAYAEAKYIAREAEALIQNGLAPESIAVLYRANFQSRILEEAFLSRGIPYCVLGTRFFERREVRDILSFIRASQNPDSVSDIERIINVPPRGIGKVTLAKIVRGEVHTLPTTMRERVQSFFSLLREIKQASETETVSEVIKKIIERSGIRTHLEAGGEEEHERLQNLGELLSLAKKYDAVEDGVSNFLEDAFLASDQDTLSEKERARGVRLMTVHASKGLEFDTVFVTGLEQELFPSVNDASQAHEIEEERRLFYVAITRAQRKVFLTYALMRVLFGTPTFRSQSEFIDDIDVSLLEEVGEAVETNTRGGGGLLDIDF